jgi:hypothetical protein
MIIIGKASFQTGIAMLIWMLTCTAFADEPADYIAQVEANLENGSLNLTFDEREFSQTVIRRRSLGSSDGWTQAEVVAELGEVLPATSPQHLKQSWLMTEEKQSSSSTAPLSLA